MPKAENIKTSPEPSHEAQTTPNPVRVATTPQSAPGEATEQEAKAFIYFKESTNRTDAINPESGACGLGQALPCSKLPCSLADYACQDAWFTRYAIERYGSFVNAKAWWIQHRWW